MAVGVQSTGSAARRAPQGSGPNDPESLRESLDTSSFEEELLAREALREERAQRFAPQPSERVNEHLASRDVAPGQERATAQELEASRQRAQRNTRGDAMKLTQEPDSSLDERLMGSATSLSAGGGEQENLNSKQAQGRVAERLNQLSRRRRAMYKRFHSAASVGSAVKRYKQLRNGLKIAKIGSGITFVGLIITLLIADVEWIYSIWNKEYPFAFWEKALTALGNIFLLILVVTVIVIMVYLYGYANDILSFLGL